MQVKKKRWAYQRFFIGTNLENPKVMGAVFA
jgi:hypothetical protein